MASVTTLTSLQFKRGAKEALERVLIGDKIPKAGEPIWESDTNKMKIGDGTHTYAELPYFSPGGGGSGDQIVFGSHYEFPSVGTINILYIAKDERNAYIWDTTKKAYVIVSVDSREIDGGGADSVYY